MTANVNPYNGRYQSTEILVIREEERPESDDLESLMVDIVARSSRLAISRIWRPLPDLNRESPRKINQLLKKIAKLPESDARKCLKRISKEMLEAAIQVLKGGTVDFHAIFDEILKSQSLLAETKPNIAMNPVTVNWIQSIRYSLSHFSPDHLPSSLYEAMQMLQVYAVILFAPLIVAGTLDDMVFAEPNKRIPFSQVILAALVAALMVAIFGSFKLYDKYKGVPSFVQPLENLSESARAGKYPALTGRDEIVDKIFESWRAINSSNRKHPLLVGDSGVGKSAIMKEVARRLVTNEVPEGLEWLAKKTLFGCSASKLLPAPDPTGVTVDALERLARTVLPCRKNIVICWDEFHSFYQNPKSAEMIKSLLDTSTEGLPYVLAATTKEEYEQHMQGNVARERRFIRIDVPPLSRKKVVTVLREMLRIHYPDVSVSEETLRSVYDTIDTLCKDFPKFTQPDISMHVLATAIGKVELVAFKPKCAKALSKTYVKVGNLRVEFASQLDLLGDRNILGEIKNAEEKKRRLIAERAKEIKNFTELKGVVERIQKIRFRLGRLAKSTNPEDHKTLLFDLFYSLPHLKAKRQRVETDLQIPQLGPDLIRTVVEEMIAKKQSTGSVEQSVEE